MATRERVQSATLPSRGGDMDNDNVDGAMYLSCPDLKSLWKEREDRTRATMQALNPALTRSVLPQASDQSREEEAAVTIQSHFRGFLGRKLYLQRLLQQFNKEEDERRRHILKQQEEGELLLENHRLEVEFEDNKCVRRNRLQRYESKVITIQRAWRDYTRRKTLIEEEQHTDSDNLSDDENDTDDDDDDDHDDEDNHNVDDNDDDEEEDLNGNRQNTKEDRNSSSDQQTHSDSGSKAEDLDNSYSGDCTDQIYLTDFSLFYNNKSITSTVSSQSGVSIGSMLSVGGAKKSISVLSDLGSSVELDDKACYETSPDTPSRTISQRSAINRLSLAEELAAMEERIGDDYDSQYDVDDEESDYHGGSSCVTSPEGDSGGSDGRKRGGIVGRRPIVSLSHNMRGKQSQSPPDNDPIRTREGLLRSGDLSSCGGSYDHNKNTRDFNANTSCLMEETELSEALEKLKRKLSSGYVDNEPLTGNTGMPGKPANHLTSTQANKDKLANHMISKQANSVLDKKANSSFDKKMDLTMDKLAFSSKRELKSCSVTRATPMIKEWRGSKNKANSTTLDKCVNKEVENKEVNGFTNGDKNGKVDSEISLDSTRDVDLVASRGLEWNSGAKEGVGRNSGANDCQEMTPNHPATVTHSITSSQPRSSSSTQSNVSHAQGNSDNMSATTKVNSSSTKSADALINRTESTTSDAMDRVSTIGSLTSTTTTNAAEESKTNLSTTLAQDCSLESTCNGSTHAQTVNTSSQSSAPCRISPTSTLENRPTGASEPPGGGELGDRSPGDGSERNSLEGVVESSLPVLDWDSLEKHLANMERETEKEEERQHSAKQTQKNSRQAILRKLAMGGDEEREAEGDIYGKGRDKLSARLQAGMNLQICFVNEDLDDSDDDEASRASTASMVSASEASLPGAIRVGNRDSRCLFSRESSTSSTTSGGSTNSKAPSVTFEDIEDFETKKAHLQEEARIAWSKAEPLAKLQMELERQQRKHSPPEPSQVSGLINLPLSFLGKRFQYKTLSRMSLSKLQIILNDLHSKVERLNDELVQSLLIRDSYMREQESRLIDIEDLNRWICMNLQQTNNNTLMTKGALGGSGEDGRKQRHQYETLLRLLGKSLPGPGRKCFCGVSRSSSVVSNRSVSSPEPDSAAAMGARPSPLSPLSTLGAGCVGPGAHGAGCGAGAGGAGGNAGGSSGTCRSESAVSSLSESHANSPELTWVRQAIVRYWHH